MQRTSNTRVILIIVASIIAFILLCCCVSLIGFYTLGKSLPGDNTIENATAEATALTGVSLEVTQTVQLLEPSATNIPPTRTIANTLTVTFTSTPLIPSETPTLAGSLTPSATATITKVPTNTQVPTNTRVPTITKTPTITRTPLPTYEELLGNVWRGVKVYYGLGSEKEYGFTILGGSENCPSMPSGRGILVLYPSGSAEWKDRIYLVGSGLFFVDEDDPALKIMDWEVYNNCP